MKVGNRADVANEKRLRGQRVTLLPAGTQHVRTDISSTVRQSKHPVVCSEQ